MNRQYGKKRHENNHSPFIQRRDRRGGNCRPSRLDDFPIGQAIFIPRSAVGDGNGECPVTVVKSGYVVELGELAVLVLVINGAGGNIPRHGDDHVHSSAHSQTLNCKVQQSKGESCGCACRGIGTCWRVFEITFINGQGRPIRRSA